MTFFRSLFVLLFLSPIMQAQKVGLVLSGGGTRGYAHIGVLKALEENNIPVDYITGTSAGALVGSFYAAGYSPQQIENIVLSNEFREWATGHSNEDLDYFFKEREPDASWATVKLSYDSTLHTHVLNPLVSSAEVDFLLMENMAAPSAKADYDFNNLFVPFRCVASDIINKKPVIFNCGDLGRAVRASISYPLYISPMTADNQILYDGGIYNNFPADVMLTDFEPDIILGSNVTGVSDIPYSENIFSQFRNMIIQQQYVSLPSANDVLINPDVSEMGVFDFGNFKAVIDSGYRATLAQMEIIKSRIARRVYADETANKRSAFVKGFASLVIDSIEITGVSKEKAQYIKKILNPHGNTLKLKQLKPRYFKMIADENIRHAFPRLIYNNQTGFYKLEIFIKSERDLRIDVGGNFSSRPISEVFIGLHYNFLGRQSLSFDVNTYFGKLYNSGQFKIRIDFPGRLDFMAEPFVILNRMNYYKSSIAFFEDIRPSYLIKSDQAYGINIGIPARNKGAIIASGALFNIKNQYYQTRDFSKTDTADVTRLEGYTASLNFERNTLNRKMYASSGTFLNIRFRWVQGYEKTIPGSIPFDKSALSALRSWWQLKMVYDNYFKTLNSVKLGFYSETNFSNQPFFANYTATALQAPGFDPTIESKTLFLENFHAHNFIGAGLKAIVSIRSNIDLRLEGFAYQPFQEILNNTGDSKAYYGDALSKRYYIASLAAVYNSPVGPFALNLNYYDRKSKSFTLLFHFGYILFNRSALD